MKLRTFVFNPLEENTYLLYDDTNECVIIDPGCYSEAEQKQLKDFIDEKGLTVKHLINTHLHFDHCFGINYVHNTFNVPLEAHAGDEEFLSRLPEQAQRFGFSITGQNPVIGKYLNEGDTISFGEQTLQILHIPGHSPGSVVFYAEEYNCAFVGDVLFQQSIGRTDLPGGDFDTLINGIKSKLYTLPEETRIFPGHGPDTTIGFEKRNNYYVNA